MSSSPKIIKEFKELHSRIKPEIEERLAQFRALWDRGPAEKLFHELVFCLLTPQSNAKQCWKAVDELSKKDLIFNGDPKKLAANLRRTRFRNNKARYVCEARGCFVKGGEVVVKKILSGFKNAMEAREWLVEHVKGYGYKEASHFLRNIGRGKNIAILDRHILKNLKRAGVIREVPKSISRKVYLDIEEKMRKFAKRVRIPLDHLDFVLWYKEAGEVFK